MFILVANDDDGAVMDQTRSSRSIMYEDRQDEFRGSAQTFTCLSFVRCTWNTRVHVSPVTNWYNNRLFPGAPPLPHLQVHSYR